MLCYESNSLKSIDRRTGQNSSCPSSPSRVRRADIKILQVSRKPLRRSREVGWLVVVLSADPPWKRQRMSMTTRRERDDSLKRWHSSRPGRYGFGFGVGSFPRHRHSRFGANLIGWAGQSAPPVLERLGARRSIFVRYLSACMHYRLNRA